MALDIGGLIINNTRVSPPDGSTAARAARSGADLARNYPNKASGFYWIQSEKMPNPLQMYVDMSEEGGGYDFYFITAGPSVNFVNVKNGGTPLGLDLVMPRSKYHWRAMSNAVRDQRPSGAYADYFTTTYGVYSLTAANYTSVIMRSHIFYGTGSSAHQVKDLGRWWLRDTTFSEPNGDYGPYGLFGGYSQPAVNYGLTDISFNDISANYATGNYYLVSTNLKP
jgi:hypothetical protein